MDKPITVITGASRGIGRAAAITCARAGHHIIAVARSQKALESLDDTIIDAGSSATIVPMDLLDFDAIDRLGGALHERYGRVDNLVHAAARLGDLTPAFHVSVDEADRIIGTNLTATWRLIRSLEPLLRVTGKSRCLFYSSGVARNPRPNWSLYAATKAAVEALVGSWALEVAFKGVGATVLNPGAIATGMRAKAFPGEDPGTLPPPEALGSLLLELLDPNRPANPGTVLNFRQTDHFMAWQDQSEVG